MTARKTVGILAAFPTADALVDAVKQVRGAGYCKLDVHTPYPIHGMDDHLRLRPSMLGWIASCGALGGGLTAIAMTWWGSTFSYPIVVSGKEFFSYQAFVPIIFELSILGAALCTVFGMIAINGLPRPYHPVFNTKLSERAGDDGLLLSIDASDKVFHEEKTTTLLKSLGATDIELIWEEAA